MKVEEGDRGIIRGNGESAGQISSNILLKIWTEGAAKTEAGTLFQYFTEKPDSLLQWWLLLWSTL